MITADIIPSMMKNDKVTMQVAALPLEINYYANEDEYAEAQPSDENGKKWLIAISSMAAISFLYNHGTGRYEQGKDYDTDRYVQFAAVVKKLYHGTFEMNGEKHNAFICCFVDIEIETVNRHVVSAGILDTEREVYISAFPSEFRVYADINAFNKWAGFSREITVEDADIKAGLAKEEDFKYPNR